MGSGAGAAAGSMLLDSGSQVDFFIHSYYEFKLFDRL